MQIRASLVRMLFNQKQNFIEKTKNIMKKLILLATFVVAGVTGSINAAPTSHESTLADSTKCYRWAVDDFGHHYLVRVTCPKVVIIK